MTIKQRVSMSLDYRKENVPIQAAFNEIKCNRVNAKLEQESLDKLNILGLCNDVWILWVLCRIWTEDNNTADELGETSFYGPRPYCETIVI